MDTELYLLPYKIISDLTGQDLYVTQSAKLMPASVYAHRYFINLREAERPLVKEKLAEITASLELPSSASALLHAEAAASDIAFIGVSAEEGVITYKIYLGFIGLHTLAENSKALSVEWIPGREESAVKEYSMQEKVTAEEAERMTQESLASVNTEMSGPAEQIYALGMDIASLTNYETHFLSVVQPGAVRRSVYYNLTASQPVFFKDVQDKILHTAGVLGIPEEQTSAWISTLSVTDVLEHLAIGVDNALRPFITFYKNGNVQAPIIYKAAGRGAPLSDLNENSANIKFNTYMEPNDKHFNHESTEADYAAVVSPKKGMVAAYPAPSDVSSYPMPQQISPSCGCQSVGGQMVFALGDIGYDFGSEVRESLEAEIGSLDPEHFLRVLGGHFNSTNERSGSSLPDPNRHEHRLFYAQSVVWTFNLDSTPIYAIRPEGPFAQETYATLRNFMVYQIEVEKKYGKTGFRNLVKSTLPGRIQGTVQLSTGYEVPVVVPELRGMYAWTVDQLLHELLGPAPAEGAAETERSRYEDAQTGVIDFLERVYFALRNVGVTSRDRAINFSATNAFQIAMIFKKTYREHLSLLSINAVKSPFCRPGADCWDVILVFFNPMKQLEEAKTIFRFTVDVSGVIPVLIGPMRSWKE